MTHVDLAQARILVVDDEPANVRLLERILTEAGYRQVRGTTDSRQALPLYREWGPDLILLDLMMPHLDGIAVMGELAIPADVFLPVLVLTADATAEAKKRALEAGAKDFLTKPFDRLEVLLRIKNLLDTRALYLELERHNRSLERMVEERTQRLLQSEKVATMGSLLAGVAHELNNPLAVVIGQAHLLRMAATEPSLVQRAERISGSADRCGRIVRNFLALARQRPPERSEVRLNMIAREVVELLAYDLRTSGVEVVLDLAEDLPVTWADGHQLHQVVVNLVANAHQAMRRMEGTRRIALTTRCAGEPPRLHLEVADSGPGIAPEIRERIFEAFFTTKPPGEGTGLGLSLCQGIVEEHGGTITLESEVGHGTTFRITLPVVARPQPAPPTVEAPASPPVSGKAILVIDDEPDLAATVAEALEGDGHDVDVAEHGAMALSMLGRRGYDLIVSDTKMPVLDGVHFYGEIEQRFPALAKRIIFLTGDVLNREKLAFLERTRAPHILKPFDVREVRALVHRMLTTPDPPTRSTILVIDDDPVVLTTVAHLLRASGYWVLSASGGSEGLTQAKAERPDLILLDYRMPEQDGLAVIERLKGDAATRGIPVVAMTSGTADEANRLIRAGCIAFIPKPFEHGSLPRLVAQFLRATVARDQPSTRR
jgi:CheY-like chemotaxis protein/nitrogen-specific signal transduction histidine kinase